MEHKLHAPTARVDWVPRPRLLQRLCGAGTRPVTLVVAPAGYGKTTLLAQYVAGLGAGGVAWVSLDAGDNDPARLWTHVVTALEQAGCAVATGTRSLSSINGAAVMGDVLPRVLNALTTVPHDVVVVLDDYHVLEHPPCHEQVDYLIGHLPDRAHLVIATREEPALRLGRLRASGQLVEVHADELGFTTDEASTVLAGKEVHLAESSVVTLVRRTEGWPAAIYLAALSLQHRGDAEEFVDRFVSADFLVTDYLAEEVLSRHADDMRDFILTISVLDRFTAELCDTVAQVSGSHLRLRELERTNLFLVPLVTSEPGGPWFRFHHLFASVARQELALLRPGELAAVHARAAAWLSRRGLVDEAFWHYREAGDIAGAALLAQTHWLTYLDAGRGATVGAWLEALGPLDQTSDPATIVLAAWLAALRGDGGAVASLEELLQGSLDHGPLPDGSRSVESALAMLHGVFGYGGRAQVVAGGRRAVELETDGGSALYSFATLAAGHAAYLEGGDLGSAASWLAQAHQHTAASRLVTVISLSLASLVEGERGHSRRSGELARAAMAVVDAHGLRPVPQASMAFTALGRVLAAEGETRRAMVALEHGLALRRQTPGLGPWSTIHHLMVMTQVAAEAGDGALAHSLLGELTDLVDRYDPDPGPTRERLADVRRSVGRQRGGATGEPLSARELEVLRMLRGPLSIAGIARELHVSSNTVKTHSRGIYHKLGAHSRAEAVEVARATGVL